MTTIQDLKIEQEILPLLDFTQNNFAKQSLLTFLQNTLPTQSEAYERQAILKGFIANQEVLMRFSYMRTDLLEVWAFLKTENFEAKSSTQWWSAMLINRRVKEQRKSKGRVNLFKWSYYSTNYKLTISEDFS